MPVYIEIIHDAENCLCNGYLDAVKVKHLTLTVILAALLDKSEEYVVDNVDMIKDVKLKWHLVLRSEADSTFYPQESFLKNMTSLGVTRTVTSNLKGGSVDVQVKQLLRASGEEFDQKKESVQDRSVVVLLSSDSDFIDDVLSLREKNIKVMLLCNETNTNQALQSVIKPHLLLKKWESIIMKSGGKKTNNNYNNTKITPMCTQEKTTRHTPEFVNKVCALAGFVTEHCGADYKWNVNVSFLHSYLPEFTTTNLKLFCNQSEGAIVYEVVDKTIAHVYVGNKASLLRLVIETKAERKLASDKMDTLYSKISSKADVKKKFKDFFGKPSAVCAQSRGLLYWEDMSDKLDRKKGSGDILLTCPDEKEDFNNGLPHLKWRVAKPKFRHLQEYSKQELDEELAKEYPNVVLDFGKDSHLCLTYVDLSGDVDADDSSDDVESPPPLMVRGPSLAVCELQLCKDIVMKFLNAIMLTESVQYDISRPVLDNDKILCSLQKEYEMHINYYKPPVASDPLGSLYCSIPSEWRKQAQDLYDLRLQRDIQTQQQPRPYLPRHVGVKNMLKPIIMQHLEVQMGVKKGSLIGCIDVQESPLLHVILKFSESNKSERNKIISNSRDSDKFLCAIEAPWDKTSNKVMIQLVYRSVGTTAAAEGGSTTDDKKTKADDARADDDTKADNTKALADASQQRRNLLNRLLRLSYETTYLTELYGKYDWPSWQYFFNNFSLLQPEVKEISEDIILNEVKEPSLDGSYVYSIKVSGKHAEVEEVAQLLNNSAKNVMKYMIRLPKNDERNREKREAVKLYLERTCKEYATKAKAASRKRLSSTLISSSMKRALDEKEKKNSEDDDDDDDVSFCVFTVLFY